MVGELTGEAKEALFREADVLVVPSYTENFGLVVPEALLREVPVIAGKGTPWERLEEMSCGLWVENDPDSLVEAIERMSRLPLQEMGKRGRAWVQNEFDPNRIGTCMLDCYCRLMTEKSKTAPSLNVCSG